MSHTSSSFGPRSIGSKLRRAAARSLEVNAVLLVLARGVWAQPVLAAPEPATASQTERKATRRQTEIGARAHVGVATTPFYVPEFPHAKGHAVVLVAHARHSLLEGWHLGFRAPVALGSVAQPAGSFVDASALGNPELELLHDWRLTRSPLTLSFGLALGAPLASTGSDLMANRLLAIADGLEGRTRPEWFTPGVVPLVPSLHLGTETGAWRFQVEFRTPVLVRVSDASASHAEQRPLGFAAVVAGGARVRLTATFSLSASAQVFVDLVSARRLVSSVSPLQDFEQLGLDVHLTNDTTLGVELRTAVGGELGGSMVGGGLGLTVDL